MSTSPGVRPLVSRDHFQLAVRLVAEHAIFLIDRDGIVSTWNLGAERIKGYAADEIVGQHFARLYTEEDVRASKPDLNLRIAAERGRFEEEGWRVCSGGSVFWASVAITALHDDQQHLVGFVKLTQDLGARRTTSAPRRVAGLPEDSVLASILEHTHDAFVVTNARGIALLASAPAERMLGVQGGFFVRRPLINLVARQDTRSFREYLDEVARAPVGTTSARVLRMRSRAGRVFAANVHVTRMDAAPKDAALHWRLEETP